MVNDTSVNLCYKAGSGCFSGLVLKTSSMFTLYDTGIQCTLFIIVVNKHLSCF